ncbi:hypothetical protein ANN_12573 [Periplaneta americana]|uniref:Uncharacterized protein n=1 Tax=Periplaneta americana TaxID=6978 RepID=A0ABQ8THK1_PERAM|nr:hypothetical protein ANN_12573 [Periplaneta americana]
MRWAGHVARMGESRNAYRVLVGRPEGKRPLGRPRRRWEGNIKMDLREVRYDDREWINLAQDRDQCEGGNEPPVSFKASKFSLSSDDSRVRVWRPRGARLNPTFAVARHTAPTAGVLVWGAITYDSRSTLVVIRGTITAQRYVQDILRPHVLPLMARFPRGLFQQDNARPHTARGEIIIMFIKMEEPKDFVTWLQVAKCFKIWDLDARGFHKSMWRMHMKGSEMLVIGVPNSEYAPRRAKTDQLAAGLTATCRSRGGRSSNQNGDIVWLARYSWFA